MNRILWKKCDLKGDSVVEKGLEQNDAADYSYDIVKNCNE